MKKGNFIDMKKVILLIILFLISSLYLTACTTTENNKVLVEKPTVYPNNRVFVNEKNEVAFELPREKYHICGVFSEDRLFCIGIKNGINVDKYDVVYSNVLIDLYLLNNKGKLIATYNDTIIPDCEVEFLEEYIPKFENGLAKIYLVRNHDIDKLNGDDIISRKDIIEYYVDKQGR